MSEIKILDEPWFRVDSRIITTCIIEIKAKALWKIMLIWLSSAFLNWIYESCLVFWKITKCPNQVKPHKPNSRETRQLCKFFCMNPFLSSPGFLLGDKICPFSVLLHLGCKLESLEDKKHTLRGDSEQQVVGSLGSWVHISSRDSEPWSPFSARARAYHGPPRRALQSPSYSSRHGGWCGEFGVVWNVLI